MTASGGFLKQQNIVHRVSYIMTRWLCTTAQETDSARYLLGHDGYKKIHWQRHFENNLKETPYEYVWQLRSPILIFIVTLRLRVMRDSISIIAIFSTLTVQSCVQNIIEYSNISFMKPISNEWWYQVVCMLLIICKNSFCFGYITNKMISQKLYLSSLLYFCQEVWKVWYF